MIWAPTAAGRDEHAGVLVTEDRQRTLLGLIDGARTEEMLLAAVPGAGAADLRKLEALGLVTTIAAPASRSGAPSASASAPPSAPPSASASVSSSASPSTATSPVTVTATSATAPALASTTSSAPAIRSAADPATLAQPLRAAAGADPGGADPAGAADTSAPASAARAKAPSDASGLADNLRRLIAAELGLRGFALTLAVENARTPDELTSLARRALEQIRTHRGEPAAAAAHQVLFGA